MPTSILQFSSLISKRILALVIACIVCSGANLIAQTSAFEVVISKKCAPTLVTFYNNSSTGASLEYLWNFGKGAQVFSDNVVLEEAYSEPGDYLVSLGVINGSDTTWSSELISILQGPKADFIVSDSVGCAPLALTFTDHSEVGDGVIATHFWDFRNGSTYSGQNLNVTLNVANDYDIYYRVTDNNGCSDFVEYLSKVKVKALPSVGFTASNQFACQPPLTVQFENLSTANDNLTSEWDFGNGTGSTHFNEEVTYAAEGSYDVSLEVTDEFGCSNFMHVSNYISIGIGSGKIIAVAGMEEKADSAMLCPGGVVIKSDLPLSSEKNWKVTYNGVEQSYLNYDSLSLEWLDSGKVVVEMTYGAESVCPDTVVNTYFVDWIDAGFSFNETNKCELPINVVATNTSQNASSYLWILPDETRRASADLNYTIPGELSHKQEFSHVVNRDRYPFTLIAFNANGCADTAWTDLLVNLPIARIMPDITSGCAPLSVTFSDSSKSDSEIHSWEYLVNGSSVHTNAGEPYSHTFNTPGTYKVQLVIQNTESCSDTSYVVNIEVGDRITPAFSVNSASFCQGEQLVIENNTVVDPGLYRWNYIIPGLGSTGLTDSLSASFTVETEEHGLFDAIVTAAYNGCFSSDTLFDALQINGPVKSFVETFSCDAPLEYTFISEMEAADNLTWEIDGVTVVDQEMVAHTFLSSGDYVVRLTGQNTASGCSVVKTKTIKVREVAAVIEPMPYACFGEPVFFKSPDSRDYLNSCYQEGFLWDFGDSTPPRRTYETEYIYEYADTGMYTVVLYVEADNGCVDTASMLTRIVAPSPVFSTNVDEGCAPNLPVTFTYDNYNSNIQSFEWIYGDGKVDSDITTVTHDYYAARDWIYYPVLYAVDIYGCTGYSSKTISMFKANADFQAYDNVKCVDEMVAFSMISQTYDSLLIDYGDGSVSNDLLRHAYQNSGTYDVVLTVYENGCEDVFSRTNYVVIEGVNADFSLSDTVVDCYPATISFQHLHPDASIEAGNWLFSAEEESGFYSASAEFTYTQPGIYNVGLMTQTGGNCTSLKEKQIEVKGPLFKFDFAPDAICSGDYVQFNVIDTANVESFSWVFGDGATSSEYEPRHAYMAKGAIVPAISIQNANCDVLVAYDTLWASIVEADFSIDTQSELCSSNIYSVVNKSSGNESSRWLLDGEIISNSDNLELAVDEAGKHRLLLQVFDTAQCSDTISEGLMVWPTPAFEINGPSRLCYGDQANLSVEKGGSDWMINWMPNHAVVNATEFETSTSVDASLVLVAEVNTSHNCISQQELSITVNDLSLYERAPLADTAIYLGQSLQLLIRSDNAELNYSWEPNTNISCTDCFNPIVRPLESRVYTLTISDTCGTQVIEFPIEVLVDFYLELPGAFTPNGDRNNDIFVYEHRNIGEIDFKIYNRWGNMVFESNTLGDGWDGVFQGGEQNIDTYTYYIRAKTVHGYEFEKKGSFVLMK